MGSEHVGMERYLEVDRGEAPAGDLLRRMQRHVLDRCPDCRREWESLEPAEREFLGSLLGRDEGELTVVLAAPPVPGGQPERAQRYAAAFDAAARQVTAAAKALNVERGRARRDLARLLKLHAADRVAALRRSRTRYRSVALAHLLVDEARSRVRRSPAEALEVLDLVRPTLEVIPGALGREWARALEVVAGALRANALRVSGDLHAADRLFREVRHQLNVAQLDDPEPVEAELASLEASLRMEQARYHEAADLLHRAVVLYEAEGDSEGLARALIQRAEVHQHFERHEPALEDLERARELLDPEKQGFLYLCTSMGSVRTLLDLQRVNEAERVLSAAEASPAAAEPWWQLRIRHLRGRLALARRDLQRAATLLTGVHEECVARCLPLDAAAAALELALVALHEGDLRRVQELAREIAPVFRDCGVVRDALAAVALLERAESADAAVLSQAAVLRRYLAAARSASSRCRNPTPAS